MAATAVLKAGASFTIAAGFLFGTWLGECWQCRGPTGCRAGLPHRPCSLGHGLPACGAMACPHGRGFAEMCHELSSGIAAGSPLSVLAGQSGPGLFGVGLRIYTIATFIGIIPGGLVYASVGNGWVRSSTAEKSLTCKSS
ncbi:MAG: hypothetical protein R3D03_13375 [Geminicoccaceae bacterium]